MLSMRGRLGALALVLLAGTAAIAGCGSGSSTPATTTHSKTLIVFGAGTLSQPFSDEIAAFEKQYPGVTVHSQFGASGDMVKAVTQLKEPDDVLGVADYSLIPDEMFGAGARQFATWYVGFVSNAITFAYTKHSKGASQLTSSNWYKILAEPGVRIGRSTPAADPSGYQILQMLKLAQAYYHDRGLSAAILRNSPNSLVAEVETSLTAALQTGEIDYLAIYRSSALEDDFLYLKLPNQINLSDPALASRYATVTVQGADGPTTGKPIIYAMTIPTNAPDPALARKFVAFVIGPTGEAIMRANGFVSVTPALASSESVLPASLRSLTVPWHL
ncbi:MAG TPA: extracellular solute-binding protein [Acidimicrobiales bacterium]|nr:extracellular solute-binding protein [Acidimicrobiales bacterium]